MTRAAVITVSDRSAEGARPDTSGPIAVSALREAGFDCADAVVVPDGADSVERALTAEVVAGVKLIVTTGGTGVSPRDQTPEGTARVVTRQVPGIAEELRRRGSCLQPRHAPDSQVRRASRTTTDFEVGVPETSATESRGTSTFVSG